MLAEVRYIFTGSILQTELNWFASVASAYAGNPYVWFGTNNEPSETVPDGTVSPSALSTWQQQTYQAVRNAGNNSMLMVEMNGQPDPSQWGAGYTASVHQGMTNMVWDVHCYGWLTDSGDPTVDPGQTAVTQELSSDIATAQNFTSADDVVPVIIGEYGNSTDGQVIDADGNEVLTAVQNSGFGSAAWAWYFCCSPGDQLTDGNANLTSYGQELASWISATAQVAPSPNDSTVTAGSSATITDDTGHKWGINASSQVTRDGTLAAYTANVTEIAYVNGVLYQENASNLWWGWSGVAWSVPWL